MASPNADAPGTPSAEQQGAHDRVLDTIILHVLSPSPEINGGRITFPSIPLETKISHLKSRIQNSMTAPAPPERQRLIYRGRALVNMDTTLRQVLQSEVSSLSSIRSRGLIWETAQCFDRAGSELYYSSGDFAYSWVHARYPDIGISQPCFTTQASTTISFRPGSAPCCSPPTPPCTLSNSSTPCIGTSAGGTSYITKPVEPASTADWYDNSHASGARSRSRSCPYTRSWSWPWSRIQSAPSDTLTLLASKCQHASISGHNHATAAVEGSRWDAWNPQSCYEWNAGCNAIRAECSRTWTYHYQSARDCWSRWTENTCGCQ